MESSLGTLVLVLFCGLFVHIDASAFSISSREFQITLSTDLFLNSDKSFDPAVYEGRTAQFAADLERLSHFPGLAGKVAIDPARIKYDSSELVYHWVLTPPSELQASKVVFKSRPASKKTGFYDLVWKIANVDPAISLQNIAVGSATNKSFVSEVKLKTELDVHFYATEKGFSGLGRVAQSVACTMVGWTEDKIPEQFDVDQLFPNISRVLRLSSAEPPVLTRSRLSRVYAATIPAKILDETVDIVVEATVEGKPNSDAEVSVEISWKIKEETPDLSTLTLSEAFGGLVVQTDWSLLKITEKTLSDSATLGDSDHGKQENTTIIIVVLTLVSAGCAFGMGFSAAWWWYRKHSTSSFAHRLEEDTGAKENRDN
eukprot:ANDGO_00881.mRNA.1 hypothetical protein